MTKSDRIRELEREVETYRYAATKLACELESILTPHRAKDAIATVVAIEHVSAQRQAVRAMTSQAVH